jgi:GNAT superfamily N-acetyltransferase
MARYLISVVQRNDPAALADVRVLFDAYLAWLGPLVGTTTLAEEIASLPRPYEEPTGALLLARDESARAVGCVGVREHSGSACEIKRLFVREDARGSGLGRALVRAGIDQARAMGYSEMYLTMYRGLGFKETEPFRDFSRVPDSVGLIFMRRGL